MTYSSEVLIYFQKVIAYFKKDDVARTYFLVDDNEKLFFEKVLKFAQENFEKNGDPMLNTEQFESIRKDIAYNPEKKDGVDVFIQHKGFNDICLN